MTKSKKSESRTLLDTGRYRIPKSTRPIPFWQRLILALLIMLILVSFVIVILQNNQIAEAWQRNETNINSIETLQSEKSTLEFNNIIVTSQSIATLEVYATKLHNLYQIAPTFATEMAEPTFTPTPTSDPTNLPFSTIPTPSPTNVG